jgi:hypothetical protein
MDMGMDPFNFADALLGILGPAFGQEAVRLQGIVRTRVRELKKLFVAEYAEELRHSKAWKADYEGETQKLVDSWVDTYGEDGQPSFCTGGRLRQMQPDRLQGPGRPA